METNVIFEKEPADGFYTELRRRVRSHFRDNQTSRYANGFMVAKCLFLFAVFVANYLVVLLADVSLPARWALTLLLGATFMISSMNIVHDACHEVLSPKRWVNTLLLYYCNLVGGNGYMYRCKHLLSHHPYTNIPGLDVDLQQSDLVRVVPITKRRWYHRYQHWYMLLLYPFYTFFWLFFRDVRYFRRRRMGIKQAQHARREWLILVGSKVVYFSYTLVLPAWLLPLAWWQIGVGFLTMHIGAGFVAMFALLSNHAGEDANFVYPDEHGRISTTWAIHQLNTTDDFSTSNPFVTFMFGGLNHHVAHHLFPRYCHVHYPAITRIVAQTARDFGLEYRSKTLWQAVRSHFRLLKQQSTSPDRLPWLIDNPDLP
ncbi:acyl-CoA desaturase [Nibrella saemangeumensis]|uniref:Acyl-CoA desaturase n=1 Tax=Nibrella saemangeumensis TaxID=1084526 RepID=A0ABP8NQN7_9BACT